MKLKIFIDGIEGEFDPTNYKSQIEFGLKQMHHYKKDTPPEHLPQVEWEIRLYEFILNGDDAEEKAKTYLKARHQFKQPAKKRDIAKLLGWEIK